MSPNHPTSPQPFRPAHEDFDAPPEKGDGFAPGGSPLVEVWTRPRATMRRILKTDPTYLVIPLACAWGLLQSLDRAVARDLGDRISTPALLGIAAIFGPLGGVLGIYLFGWLWSWAGRKLGGVGDPTAVRAAIAWGQTPAVPGIAIRLVQLAAVGPELFRKSTPNMDASPGLRSFFLGTLVVLIVLGVWSFFMSLKCIGEAHRFSAWRALGAVILGTIAFFIPIILMMVALMIAMKG